MQQTPEQERPDAAAADAVVALRGVSFAYDPAVPVLRDINMTMKRGAVVGIMGQSGCGKTTTLRIIMGALRPTGGTARVLGAAVEGLDGEALYAMRDRKSVV